MIDISIAAVFIVHGLIHFLGAAKAFKLAEVRALSHSITRTWGGVWALSGLAMVAAGACETADWPSWWLVGAGALLLSQLAIVRFWRDAKFGTLVNVLLAVPIAIGYGQARFDAASDAALADLAARRPLTPSATMRSADLATLPPPVAHWLEEAGVVGRRRTVSVIVEQHGEMQTSADDAWMPFTARQWILTATPGFLWLADVEGPRGLPLVGRDRYLDGRGSMRIELLSLVPVADASGPKIDQGALVRFLAEIVWYPSAAVAPYLHWEASGPRAARATMRIGNIEAVGEFSFDSAWRVVRFRAKRYRADRLEDWFINNDPKAFRVMDGVRIPTHSSITWSGADRKPWTWLRLDIVGLKRNAPLTR